MFGVFSVNESLVAFQYIFAICNSLQVDKLVYYLLKLVNLTHLCEICTKFIGDIPYSITPRL